MFGPLVTSNHPNHLHPKGIVLWELFSYGKIPYGEISNDAAAKKIIAVQTLEIGSHWPKEIQNVCSSCWKADPSTRITMQEISEKIEGSPSLKKEAQSPLYQNI